MTTAQLIIKLEKRFTKDFGDKCPDFDHNCFVCQGWMAIDILKDLYDFDTPPQKINKKKLIEAAEKAKEVLAMERLERRTEQLNQDDPPERGFREMTPEEQPAKTGRQEPTLPQQFRRLLQGRCPACGCDRDYKRDGRYYCSKCNKELR